MFGLATLAEAFRYGLLVFNRVRLVDPLTLAISDAMVWSTQLSGPLVAVAAAVAVACRLHVERARVFADRGLTDPRPLREILVGVLVPGLNLVMPAVYLREIAGDDRRLRRAIRLWWTAWVTGGVLVVANVLWRNQDSLQARADGVVLAAVTAAVGVATALLALLVIRRLDGRDLLGRPHPVTRWINVPRPEEAMADEPRPPWTTRRRTPRRLRLPPEHTLAAYELALAEAPTDSSATCGSPATATWCASTTAGSTGRRPARVLSAR